VRFKYITSNKAITKIIRKFLNKFFLIKFVEIIVLTTRVLRNT